MTSKRILYVEQEELKKLILENDQTFTIVDVRDIDFPGGNITGATNVPYFTEDKAKDLAEDLIAKKHSMVIFHCFYCRMRGPTAARCFERVVKRDYPDLKIKIRVLRGGWSRWKNQYKKDDRLVENMKSKQQTDC